MAKAGRPSKFSKRLADLICERMIEGESLVEICRDDGIPDRRTIYRWMDADPDFAARCERAREGQADALDQKIMDVAEASTEESFQSDKVKISAYQWRAAKLAPRRYGERTVTELTGPGGGPIQLEAVRAELTDRLARLAAGGEAPALPGPADGD